MKPLLKHIFVVSALCVAAVRAQQTLTDPIRLVAVDAATEEEIGPVGTRATGALEYSLIAVSDLPDDSAYRGEIFTLYKDRPLPGSVHPTGSLHYNPPTAPGKVSIQIDYQLWVDETGDFILPTALQASQDTPTQQIASAFDADHVLVTQAPGIDFPVRGWVLYQQDIGNVTAGTILIANVNDENALPLPSGVVAVELQIVDAD